MPPDSAVAARFAVVRFGIAVLLVAGLWLAGAGLTLAAAPEQTIRKLASLAPLPSLTGTMGISSEHVRSPELALTTNEMAARIVGLRKELKGEPGDAERLYEIARLLKISRRGSEAAMVFSNAAALYRTRAVARPGDGALQARFADVLQEIDRQAEAEHVLRAAIVRLPRDWHCHSALGALLYSRVSRALLGTNAASYLEALATVTGAPDTGYTPTPENLGEAEKCRAEAMRCFDRAVELAPMDPGPWLARAFYHVFGGMFQQVIDRARGKSQARASSLFDFMGSDEACADWEQVARLSRTNHLAIAYWGWCEASPAIAKPDEGKPIDRLSDRRRRHLLESIRMLEGLVASASKPAAAAASEAIGLLRASAFQDFPGAMTALRRAVTLDPTRRNSWECLVGLTAMEGTPSELIEVCEQHLKHIDTARSRIMLAKAFDSAGRSDEALSQARQAVELDRQEIAAHLCVSALLLRRTVPSDSSQPWGTHLSTAMRLIEQMGDSDKRPPLIVNFMLQQAVGFGIAGEPGKARQVLRNAMEFAPDARALKCAKEIELALGR